MTATYVTLADLIGPLGYLDQVDVTDEDLAQRAQNVLDRAESIVNAELGFTFEAWGAPAARNVRAQNGVFFTLPAHQIGSVSAVETMSGTAITDFVERDSGRLYGVDSQGWEIPWQSQMYAVTAIWGYGPVPDAVKGVVLEVAVNMWRSAETGHFTNVIGAQDGGAVGYEGALTPQQKMVIKTAVQNATPIVV